jgi:uncharacterized protein YndB with AHSA1/START domain
MTSWHRLEDCDESFFTTAPQRFSYTVDLTVPPGVVWESLTSDESVAAWSRLISSLRWTSARPFGVGTTREVTLPGKGLAFREQYFLWDEGRRYAFFATEATLPVFRRFAEDYVVEPAAGGSRFTWTFALEARRGFGTFVKLSRPVNALLFGRMAGSARGYFAPEKATR